ncbi:hypothetical protein ACQP1P_22270 [Dactylosporangium sp. CA-052675]|uniref:hypothetical protein n=1 Tax=Dactylosporangium sp. CA-052675 TaxID=3239927 RepID=UPI003D8A31B8
MSVATDVSPPTGELPPGPAATGRAWSLVPLPTRLHRYGGVLVAPPLAVAAVTGLLFAFSPQRDRFVYRLLLGALAIGPLCVITWGYRTWWQRRPTRADRRAPAGPPPARGAWRGVRPPLLVAGALVTAAIGRARPGTAGLRRHAAGVPAR